MKKSNKWLSFGLATALVVTAGSAFAASTTPTGTDQQQQQQKQQGDQWHHHDGKKEWKNPFTNDSALLSLLKTDEKTLKADLKSGKSLAEIAESKQVSKQKVIDHLVSRVSDRLDKAVQAGKLPKDKAAELKAKLPDRMQKMVEHKGLWHKGNKHGHKAAGYFHQAASALGMKPKDLMNELKTGKSIAQIAKEKGISQDQLTETLLQKDKARIAKFLEKSNWGQHAEKAKDGAQQK